MNLRSLLRRLTTDPVREGVPRAELAEVHYAASELTCKAAEVERRLQVMAEGDGDERR